MSQAIQKRAGQSQVPELLRGADGETLEGNGAAELPERV